MEPEATPADAKPEAPAAPKTFTQEEVDRIVADRLKREDVRGLKAKAQQFDAAQEASKSEMQKLTEQIAALTAAQQRADADAARYRIAAAHGIATEDADLFLTGSDEESITAQANALVARDQNRKAAGNVVPNEGRTPNNPTSNSSERDLLRQLFGNA